MTEPIPSGGPRSEPEVRAVIAAAIARLERRERSLAFLRKLFRSLFYLSIVGLIALVAGAADWSRLIAPWLAGAAFAAGLATLWTRRPALGLAKEYDDALDLKDRLSSALEISSDSPMAEHLREQAFAVAGRLDPARVHRFRMPREGYWLPLPIAAAALFVLLPGLLRGAPETNPALEEAVALQRIEIERAISEFRKDPERFRERIELLEELKSQLEKKNLEKKEALTTLAEAMAELEKQLDEEMKQELEQRQLLEQLAKSGETQPLADEIAEGDYESAEQKLDELEERLRKELEELKKSGADPRRQEELEEQLKRLERLRAQLADLKNLRIQAMRTGQVLDLLSDFEGELGEIGDLDAELAKVVDLPKKHRGCPT